MELTQYSPDFQRFLKENEGKIEINGIGLTGTQHEWLEFLVKHKIGDFESVLKLYRDLTK